MPSARAEKHQDPPRQFPSATSRNIDVHRYAWRADQLRCTPVSCAAHRDGDASLSGWITLAKEKPARPRRSTLLWGCLRNSEEEGRPAIWRALDPDATAVSLDDALGDGKAEPSALAVRACRLPESVKDAGQVLGADPTAVSETRKMTS